MRSGADFEAGTDAVLSKLHAWLREAYHTDTLVNRCIKDWYQILTNSDKRIALYELLAVALYQHKIETKLEIDKLRQNAPRYIVLTQEQLNQLKAKSHMRKILIPDEVQTLLDRQAPVAVGVSGGKDSMAVAWAVTQHLKDYGGPKVLIHADLKEVEWLDSWPACERIAAATGWDLVSCHRPAGGMMERWESRWQSSIRRYCAMETVAVVLPWSTPSMRFCTSELKVAPITSTLKKRFGNKTPMINATGVRAEESSARAKQPVSSPEANLPRGSLSWRPIHDWELADVWAAIAESGVEPHEAYGKYGSSRVSCRFCILANQKDLAASLQDVDGHTIYRRMCELEIKSGFAFQGSRWLTSLASHLLDQGPGQAYGSADVPWGVSGSAMLAGAQLLMARRQAAEAWIPKHLQFTKGWPNGVPTFDESEKLANMRREICGLYGWSSPYLTAQSVKDRYRELWDIKQAKIE